MKVRGNYVEQAVLPKRVDDPNAIHLTGILHVFRKQNTATGLTGRIHPEKASG